MHALNGSAPTTPVLAVKRIVEHKNGIADIGVAFCDSDKESESQGASIPTA